MTKFRKPSRTILLSATAAIALGVGAIGVQVFDAAEAIAAQSDSGKRLQGQGQGQGQGGQGGGLHGHGQGPSLLDDILRGPDSDDDSDRPEWAGTPGQDGKPGNPNPQPGVSKGGIYGDLYVILRDDNGIPLLYVWEDTDGDGVPDTAVPTADGFVQPIDAEGNLIPLDAEGEPIDETLLQEVEFSRLNVGRSPTRVLLSRYDEAIAAINTATSITLDAAGRLVLTIDGVENTIDSPLENLALYVELMNTGTLGGVTVDPSVFGDLAFLVDGSFTVEDFDVAASLLAAAADKTGELTVDEIVYLNTYVGVEGTLTDSSGSGSYVDFSTFTYDRSDAFADTTAYVLILQPDGSWVAEEVNIFEAVFDGTDVTAEAGADSFAQAADDALQVIEFIHEYEVPTVASN